MNAEKDPIKHPLVRPPQLPKALPQRTHRDPLTSQTFPGQDVQIDDQPGQGLPALSPPPQTFEVFLYGAMLAIWIEPDGQHVYTISSIYHILYFVQWAQPWIPGSPAVLSQGPHPIRRGGLKSSVKERGGWELAPIPAEGQEIVLVQGPDAQAVEEARIVPGYRCRWMSSRAPVTRAIFSNVWRLWPVYSPLSIRVMAP